MTTRKPIPRALTIQLIKTHGIMCQNCKNTEFEEIHHIDKDPCNNVFSNLMLLCSECHNDKHRKFPRINTGTRQIKIQDQTYERLTNLGKKNETYDEIINRCIDSHERLMTREKSKK